MTDVPIEEGVREVSTEENVVLHELRDRVAWITINRPAARNALNHDARRLLLGCLQAC